MKTIEIPCSGYAVVADWYDGRDADKIILFLYGYSSMRANHRPFMQRIVEDTGESALVFDYTGHGDSPFELGDTRPGQHLLEVTQVYDWLRERHPNATITVMGTSFGGFLATHLSHYRAYDALVLSAPAIYQPSDLFTPWRFIDREWTRDVFRTDVDALTSHPLFTNSLFNGGALVIAHELDDTIPMQTIDAYAEGFSADKYVAPNLYHSLQDVNNTQATLDAHRNKIIQWINTIHG